MTEHFSEIFEPGITTDYLKSAENCLPSVEAVFANDTSIPIQPKPLENTSFALDMSLRKHPFIWFAFIRLTFSQADQRHIIPGVFLNLKIAFQEKVLSDNDLMVEGNIANGGDTEEIKALFDAFRKQHKIPKLTNFSGLVAPYEDAVCFHLAQLFPSKQVVRVVSTQQPELSRLVNNYRNRGYSSIPREFEEDLILHKIF